MFSPHNDDSSSYLKNGNFIDINGNCNNVISCKREVTAESLTLLNFAHFNSKDIFSLIISLILKRWHAYGDYALYLVCLVKTMVIKGVCNRATVLSGGSKGGRSRRATPTAQNFCNFMQLFGNFDKIVASSWGVGAPSYGESWIRPWYCTRWWFT